MICYKCQKGGYTPEELVEHEIEIHDYPRPLEPLRVVNKNTCICGCHWNDTYIMPCAHCIPLPCYGLRAPDSLRLAKKAEIR